MADAILSSLLRLHRQCLRHLRAVLQPYQYVGVMHLIVLYLRRKPGASQEEIACFYALDKTGVARDAKRLEEMGHIRRDTVPADRRQYQIYLTEAGEAMGPVLEAAYESFIRRITAGVSTEEQETLRQLLYRLERNGASAQ